MPPESVTVRVVLARSAPAASVAGVLDAGERARLADLRRPADADGYAGAHALLRRVVGRELGRDPESLAFTATCRTCGGPHGRPEVRGHPELQLSLSHTTGLVAVAVSSAGPVGVDVELVSAAGFDGFAAVALAPGERARTPRERATTWVRKEALLKATGHGLAVAPGSVRLSAPERAPRLLAWTAAEPPGPVQLHDVAVGADHAAAVAVLGRAEQDLQVRWHAW